MEPDHNIASKLPRFLSPVGSIVDVFALGALSAFLFFWKLGATSLGSRDESLFTLAAQGIQLTGNWWEPTVNGRPFVIKPPLKMWITIPFLELFGSSNFTFRLPDALIGIATVLLVYWFGILLFRSRAIGVVAALALLCCPGFVLIHGPRQAVLDTALVFLFTASMYCAWQLVRALSDMNGVVPNGARRWAVLGGVAIGLAAFTKSAAAVPPLILVFVYLVLSGELRTVLVRGWSHILTVLALAVAIPAPYFVWHSLYTPQGFFGLIYLDVFKRASVRLYEVSTPWYYLENIFSDRLIFPPELLLFAIVIAVFAAVMSRSRAQLFLLVWSLGIVALFSTAKTRFFWYIAPSFPAFALMIGAAVVQAGRLITFPSPGRQKFSWRDICVTGTAFGVVAGAIVIQGVNFAKIISTIAADENRIEADLLASDLMEYRRDTPTAEFFSISSNVPNPKARGIYRDIVVPHRKAMIDLDFSFREMPYRNIFLPYITPLERGALSPGEQRGFQEGDVVITDARNLERIQQVFPFQKYLILQQIAGRSQVYVALANTSAPELAHFVPAKRLLPLTDSAIAPLSGFVAEREMSNSFERRAKSMSSAFAVQGDWLQAHLGCTVNFQIGDMTKPMTITLSVNDKNVADVVGVPGKPVDVEARLPAGLWKSEKNIFSFKVVTNDGMPISDSDTAFVLSRIVLSLG